MATQNRRRKAQSQEEELLDRAGAGPEAAPELAIPALAPEPTPVEAAPVPDEMKPFEIDIFSMTLGDLEFMEQMATLEETGQKPSVSQLFELFTRFLVGYTIEDCRKIKIMQIEPLKQQLYKEIMKAVPNGKGTAS